MVADDDIPQDGGPDEAELREMQQAEFEADVSQYMEVPAFVEAVRRVTEMYAKSYRIEDCADERILAELERKWDRSDPTNAFGLYSSIKAENPNAWVSPEVSLRMLASVEYLARNAINEATRA